MSGYRVALVGNPNVGKTTLYNALTGENEKVGNWHGVTVEARTAHFEVGGARAELTDLPGVYSLTAYSPEETVTADAVRKGQFDLIVNVAEAANLRRSLLLTRELLLSRTPVLLVVNMIGEFRRRGGEVDCAALSRAIGAAVIAEDCNERRGAERVRAAIGKCLAAKNRSTAENASAIAKRQTAAESVTEKGEGADEEFLRRAARAVRFPPRRGRRLDALFLNPLFAFPFFFALLAAVFAFTFASGAPGAVMTGALSELFSEKLAGAIRRGLDGAPLPAVEFLAGGLAEGLGSVAAFLPQVALLQFFLGVMEETGYLARVAFVTDGVLKKAGLNGRAAFSAAMGFGCTAAAATTARGLGGAVKKKTLLSLPFLSCSARVPVYLVLVNAFFAKSRVWVLLAVYAGGLALALAASFLADRLFCRGEDRPFLMELPPYRLPNAKKLLKLLSSSVKQFIIRVGTALFVLMAALWFARSFSPDFRFLTGDGIGESILARLGGALSFLFRPMGISGWQIPAAALAGLVAKEAVAGTLALVCPGGLPLTPASALAFLAFAALYTPCAAAVASVARETDPKFAFCSAAAQFGVALLAGYAVYAAAGGYGAAGRIAAAAAALAVPALALAAVRAAEKRRARRGKTESGDDARAAGSSLFPRIPPERRGGCGACGGCGRTGRGGQGSFAARVPARRKGRIPKEKAGKDECGNTRRRGADGSRKS